MCVKKRDVCYDSGLRLKRIVENSGELQNQVDVISFHILQLSNVIDVDGLPIASELCCFLFLKILNCWKNSYAMSLLSYLILTYLD